MADESIESVVRRLELEAMSHNAGVEKDLALLRKDVEAQAESNASQHRVLDAKHDVVSKILPLISASLTLGLLITFGYQIIKSVEVTGLVDKLEAKQRALDGTQSTLYRQRLVMADLTARLTRAIVLVSNGHRDAVRQRLLAAKRQAIRSEEEIKDYVILLEANGDSTKLEQLTPELKEKLNLLRPSIPAIRETYIALLELRARSNVFLYTKEDESPLKETLADGEKLVKLAPGRWEGHHFVGVAKDGLSDFVSTGEQRSLREAARKQLEKAVECDDELAVIDMLNLAESFFVDDLFEQSARWAKRYIETDGVKAPLEQAYLGSFFATCARYATSKKLQDIQRALAVACALSQNVKKLEKNWSWERLEKLLKNPSWPGTKTSKVNGHLRFALQTMLDASKSDGSEGFIDRVRKGAERIDLSPGDLILPRMFPISWDPD